MRDITIRTLQGFDELRDALAPVQISFGNPLTDQHVTDARNFVEPERFHTAWDGDLCVGSAAALTWMVAVPGDTMRTAAVTEVGVLPTHRRRGIARRLMAEQLDAAAERGDVIATLFASESVLYGRYGYGMATMHAGYRIDTHRAAFRDAPAIGGSFSMPPVGEARDAVVRAWERSWSRSPGEHDRASGVWDLVFRSWGSEQDGHSIAVVIVHHDDAGEPDGYVVYRTRGEWADAIAANEVRVVESAAVDDDVEAALLGAVFCLDLVRTVDLPKRPVRDPLRWRLVDPRQLRTRTAHDAIWLRLLDVAAALAQRRYERPDDINIGVHDPFRPDGSGTYRLVVRDDGTASCRRVDDEPAVTLDVADLGALHLGQQSAIDIARAGRIDGDRRAVGRLDDVFRWSEPARSRTDF